eukprot:gene8626-8807_t
MGEWNWSQSTADRIQLVLNSVALAFILEVDDKAGDILGWVLEGGAEENAAVQLWYAYEVITTSVQRLRTAHVDLFDGLALFAYVMLGAVVTIPMGALLANHPFVVPASDRGLLQLLGNCADTAKAALAKLQVQAAEARESDGKAWTKATDPGDTAVSQDFDVLQ